VGGQGDVVSTPAPNKFKGKVVRVVHSNDEASSDDDIPLQWRMREASSGRSVAGVGNDAWGIRRQLGRR
jgi:hypothetical protein